MERAQREELHRCMVRLADGDRDAFPTIYSVLWPVLRRFAQRVLPDAAEADDAAQSVLMKVFSRAAEFDSTADALSWALGIAAYECRTLRQKRRRRREDPEGPSGFETLEGSGTNPEEATIARDLEAAMATVLGTLREVDVETLRLVARGERPDGATFRKRVERALARLRAAWRTRHGTD